MGFTNGRLRAVQVGKVTFRSLTAKQIAARMAEKAFRPIDRAVSNGSVGVVPWEKEEDFDFGSTLFRFRLRHDAIKIDRRFLEAELRRRQATCGAGETVTEAILYNELVLAGVPKTVYIEVVVDFDGGAVYLGSGKEDDRDLVDLVLAPLLLATDSPPAPEIEWRSTSEVATDYTLRQCLEGGANAELAAVSWEPQRNLKVVISPVEVDDLNTLRTAFVEGEGGELRWIDLERFPVAFRLKVGPTTALRLRSPKPFGRAKLDTSEKIEKTIEALRRTATWLETMEKAAKAERERDEVAEAVGGRVS